MTSTVECWLAHEGELLLDHLRSVGELARRFAPDSLADAAELAGLVHDLGKATPFFQARLHGQGGSGAEANHAYLGALYGAWVAEARGWDALAVFLAVTRHHGSLRTPHELLPHPSDIDPPNFLGVDRQGLRRTLRALPVQLHAVRQSWPVLCPTLGLPDPLPFLDGEVWGTLRRLAEEALALAYLAEYETLEPLARRRFWETNIVFSALIDADKKLAASYRASHRFALPADLVDRYLVTLGGDRGRPTRSGNRVETPDGGPLGPFRRQLYQAVDERIRSEPLERLYPALLTLTASTGAGKTLTVLNAALKLRERIERERGLSPRIVYALPFVNLIEQTADVVRDLLINGGIDPADVLLTHHHLAPLAQRTPLAIRRSPGDPERPASASAQARSQASERSTPDDDLVGVDESLLLAESWDAEIVLTTFVQVFHTLVGYQNRMLKKLHTLAEGAILVLDEVQTLDARYWPLLRAVLSDLPQWGVTVILMTATQPALVDRRRVLELAPPLPGYPARVVLRPAEPRTVAELAEAVAARAGQSQLVVVNSVRVSLELFEALRRERLPYLFYLSTNVTPRDRGGRLKEIRALLRQHLPVVLVATQVVEAGVDVDFDSGWREWGPLESLVQVAGRINRNAQAAAGERELGVVELVEGQGHLVYGRVLLEAAKQALSRPLADRAVEEILAAYFDTIEQRITQERAWRLLAALPRLDYDRSGVDCHRGGASLPVCCFQLIEEPPSLSIFVEQDGYASEILEAFRAAYRLPDPNQRRLALRRLRPSVELYTITPLLRRALGNLPRPLFHDREDPRLIRREELDSFYDEQTGFKWEISQFL